MSDSLLDISAQQEALKAVLFEIEGVDAPPFLGDFDGDPANQKPLEIESEGPLTEVVDRWLESDQQEEVKETEPPEVESGLEPPAAGQPPEGESPLLGDLPVPRPEVPDRPEKPPPKPPKPAPEKPEGKIQVRADDTGGTEQWKALRQIRETVNGLIDSWGQRQSVAVPQLLPIQSRYDFTAPAHPHDVIEGKGVRISRLPGAMMIETEAPVQVQTTDDENPPIIPPGGTAENPKILTPTPEGTETAATDTWDRASQGTNDGVIIRLCTRPVYNEAGDAILYAFYRSFKFDSLGVLMTISAETRYTVDAPVDCP